MVYAAKALATAAIDAAAKLGPLDHAAHIMLWEQRGIASAYVGDHEHASAAFDMLLALDPSHILSYRLSTKATFVFEDVRRDQRAEATRGEFAQLVAVDLRIVDLGRQTQGAAMLDRGSVDVQAQRAGGESRQEGSQAAAEIDRRPLDLPRLVGEIEPAHPAPEPAATVAGLQVLGVGLVEGVGRHDGVLRWR